MNRKFNPSIAVGAVLLLIGVVVLAVLAARGNTTTASKVKALVASADVPAGTPAGAAHLQVQDVAAGSVPSGAPRDLSELTGTTATAKILQGQVITATSFARAGAATSTGVTLPVGLQAVGVELGFAPGALRYVIAGNYINVWVAPKPKPAADGTVPVVRGSQLVAGVQVLSTTPGAGDGSKTAPVPGPGNLDFLLAVNANQASKIIGAAAQPDAQVMYFTLAKTSAS
jgi:Flp pilus assembly protein CpaB